MNADAWDKWFDVQYGISNEVERLVKERTEGMSGNFRAAVYAGLIETMSENMRIALELPASDSRESGLNELPQVVELGGAIGRTATSACKQGQHDLCVGACYCRCHE